jgi:hypothetical protein
VRRSGDVRGPFFWLLLFLLVGLAAGLGTGMAETLKVERANTQLYESPNFGSRPLGSLPAGAEVAVLSRSGDWVQVNYQGKSGWVHKTSIAQAPAGRPGLALPGMLTGGPVRQTKSDEVALAGKGFTPEVEAAYRQKNPGMNYAMVDQVERFQVDPGQLAAFIREGGLTP